MPTTISTGRVTGGLHAPDGKQIVTGTVIFTPDAPLYPEGGDGPVLDAPTTYELVGGKLPDVELATAARSAATKGARALQVSGVRAVSAAY